MAFSWKRYFALVSFVLLAALVLNSAAFAQEGAAGDAPEDLRETVCRIELADQVAAAERHFGIRNGAEALARVRAMLSAADREKVRALTRAAVSDDAEVAVHASRKLLAFGFELQTRLNTLPDGSVIPMGDKRFIGVRFSQRGNQPELAISRVVGSQLSDGVLHMTSTKLEGTDDRESLRIFVSEQGSTGLITIEEYVQARLPEFCRPSQPPANPPSDGSGDGQSSDDDQNDTPDNGGEPLPPPPPPPSGGSDISGGITSDPAQ